ncbi:MAG: uroporphyrinogen-III synthase [Acidimicrobiia bacterium]
MLAPLEGFVVGITADRRADEQADLLTRRGARVVHGPMIRTHSMVTDDALRHATEEVIAHPPDYVVANTGIGVRGWLTAAATWGWDDDLTSALAGSRVVARGAKAAGAMASIGVDVWWRAPSESLREVLARLLEEPLDGATVAFQLHGADSPEFAAALREAGARLVEVPVYRWEKPDAPEAARALVAKVCSGDVDAVTFTSAPAIAHCFEIAAADGHEAALRSALNERVVVAVVGPYCAEAARIHGLDDLVEPVAARMGSMVRALTERLHASQRTVRDGRRLVTVQGRAVSVRDVDAPVVATNDGDDDGCGCGEVVWLPTRERWLLDRLVQRPGVVVSRAHLCRAVWGAPVDEHALDVTMARLRRSLGAAGVVIETLPKRGYRIVGTAGI